jgi:diketogulonate reductase-like aldo/keto reductase
MSFSRARRKALALGASFALGGLMPRRRAVAATHSLLTRAIPRSGEAVPVVGLGTWQVFDVAGNSSELAQAKETLRQFVALGGKVVDSSPMYGSSESVVGELASALGIQKQLFVATKVWTSGREAGIRQMEESMAKLRAPRIELMQVHNLVDARTHLATLRDWQRAGRVRYVGVTHYTESAYRELETFIADGIDFVQVNYSLGEREAEARLLRRAADTQTAVLVNRPFMEGALFRRVRDKPLPSWAAEIDCATWAQYLLKWIISHPAVTCAIPGTRTPKHIVDNLGAARGRMPDEAMRRRMAEYFDRL